MRHPREQRVEVYARAMDGLLNLESDWNKQRKYADFIDAYANLTEDEMVCYREKFINTTAKEKTMGLVSVLLEEGRQEGRQEEGSTLA